MPTIADIDAKVYLIYFALHFLTWLTLFLVSASYNKQIIFFTFYLAEKPSFLALCSI